MINLAGVMKQPFLTSNDCLIPIHILLADEAAVEPPLEVVGEELPPVLLGRHPSQAVVGPEL